MQVNMTRIMNKNTIPEDTIHANLLDPMVSTQITKMVDIRPMVDIMKEVM